MDKPDHDKQDALNVTPQTPPAGGDGDKAPLKDESFEITVAGEKRSVTLEEMKNLAQKAAGADRRFEDANELRKQAERGLRITDLIDSLSQNPSDGDARELAVLLGIDPKDFEGWMNEERDNEPPQDKKGDAKPNKEELTAMLREALGVDPAEARSILEYSHQRHIEAAKKEIREKSDIGVDKDEVFGKMVSMGGEKNKESRLATIKEMVAEDVLRKIQDGVPFGADTVAASIQKIRAYLTKFGIPSKPDRYPVMGLGPGSGLPTEVNSDEPITRVTADKDDSETNLVARYMQKALRKLRESS